MSATADLIIERRRTRRRLAFWRIAAIVAFVIAILAVLPAREVVSGGGSHVARVAITGVIVDDPRRDAVLRKIAESDSARAVVVRIDSPGGTVTGSEALFDGLRAIAAQKPVIAVMGEVAASGGYIAALGADHIVARSNTITGSIGVVAEIPNVAGLIEMLGVEVTRIKSAPLKAEPSLTGRPSEAAIAAQKSLIDDSFAWFRDLVADRRGLEGEALTAVIDGRVHTGRQAVALGLIDGLGDLTVAREWLAETHDIDTDLTLRDWSWTESPVPWPLSEFDDGGATLAAVQRLVLGGPRLYALLSW